MAEILPQIKISNGPSRLASQVKPQTANMKDGYGGARLKPDISVEGGIAISAVVKGKLKIEYRTRRLKWWHIFKQKYPKSSSKSNKRRWESDESGGGQRFAVPH